MMSGPFALGFAGAETPRLDAVVTRDPSVCLRSTGGSTGFGSFALMSSTAAASLLPSRPHLARWRLGWLLFTLRHQPFALYVS
jgi:hypothetical protein